MFKNMYKYNDQYKVLNEWQMASDHIPIEITLKSVSKEAATVTNSEKFIRFNFHKAD